MHMGSPRQRVPQECSPEVIGFDEAEDVSEQADRAPSAQAAGIVEVVAELGVIHDGVMAVGHPVLFPHTAP